MRLIIDANNEGDVTNIDVEGAIADAPPQRLMLAVYAALIDALCLVEGGDSK